jgi:hypothetical protein
MGLDEHEQNVLKDIDRVGWGVVCIPAGDEGPGFVYSVGMMHTLGHPEIIMFGLGLDLMGGIINGMGDEIRKGRRFEEPGLYDGLLERYACKCLPVDERHHEEYLGYAMWHRRHVGQIGTLRAVQCVWPDKAGLFPEEVGCHPSVVRLQPVLGTGQSLPESGGFTH